MTSENTIIMSSDTKDTELIKSDKLSTLFDSLFTYIVESKCNVAYCQISTNDSYYGITFIGQSITIERFYNGNYYKVAIITKENNNIDPNISLHSANLVQTLLNYTPVYFNLYANPFENIQE